jgi:large subunit ribosomal protein L25
VNAAARPTLAAERREITGKHVARLRHAGKLPAVVFGHGMESQNVQLDAHEFDLLRRHSGSSTLLDLVVDGGKATPAIVQGVQIHPMSRRPLHVDIFAVRMTEELTVDVPVVTTGSNHLIDRENGTLTHVLNTVRVRALPDHLPQSLEVSIEWLASFDDVIHVRDLTVPSDAHIVNDPDDVVVRILAPRVEVEEAVEAPAAEEAGAAEAGEAAEEAAATE